MNKEPLIFECPSCENAVVVGPDGLCPACREPVPADAPQLVRVAGSPLGPFAARMLVTPAIVAVNVLVFVVMVLSGVDPMHPDTGQMAAWGANQALRTFEGQWWRLFTCMFLHFGIIHLALNMYVFWDLGRLVERIMGNTGFAILYLISGIAASLTSVVFHIDATSAGASGAIFGVAGGLLGLIAFRRDILPPEIVQSLRRSLGTFVMINVIIAFALPFIDFAAHAGGFVAGFICGVAMSHKLTLTAVRSREIRNLSMATFGVGMLFIFWFLLPQLIIPRPASMLRNFERYRRTALDNYAQLLTDRLAEKISDEQLAKDIQEKVLQPWKRVSSAINRLKDIPEIREDVKPLAEFARLKREAWMLEVEGLRTGDGDKRAAAQTRHNQAEQILEKASQR